MRRTVLLLVLLLSFSRASEPDRPAVVRPEQAATSGNGTASNPYVGWEASLEPDGVVAEFAPGYYLAKRTVNLHGAFAIYGRMAIVRKITAGAVLAVNDVPGATTNGFALRDLRLDGQDKGDYGLTVGNEKGPVYSANGLIENVSASHFTKAGVWLRASQLLTMVRVEAAFNAGFGFTFDGRPGDNTTTNCYGCRAFSNGVGLAIFTGHGLNFNGFTSESNKLEGVKIVSHSRSVREVHFAGCWFEQNNKARPNGKSGQLVADSDDKSPVEGLTIEDSTFAIAGPGNRHYIFSSTVANPRVQNLHLQAPAS